MNKIALLLLFLTFSFCISAQEKNIEATLSEIPDITYSKINEADGYEFYVLHVKQPIDHSDTNKGFFSQKVYLSHKGYKRPTVIVTAGYSEYRNRKVELTKLLDANQIIVEHRYFGESMPDSLDYKYLNLKQATADLHKIKELLSSIYKNKWISTGVSKGGVTTIFYRYFFPNDVDVSVPYVAPINKSYEDPRYYNFLDTVGTDECRAKIKNFQIRILKNREKIIPLLKFYSIGARAKYSYVTIGEAFEYAVMEYPFTFWQRGHDCNKIPSETANIEEITEYFLYVSNLTFFSDRGIRNLTSHYYQSATELGYYGYETSKFKDYLVDLPTDHNPMALFFSFDMTDKFNDKLLKDVDSWLKTDANKLIYIYGESDTWSAGAVPPNDNVDSEWFMLKGKNHDSAKIKSMTPTEKKRFISTLEKWLSMKIVPSKK